MNRKILLLSGLFIVGGVLLYYSRPGTSSQTDPLTLAFKASSTLKLHNADPVINAVSLKGTTLQDQVKVDQAVKEYQEAAYALATKIEKLGLDGEELNELFNRVGKENFLNHVPEEIRPDYLLLEEKIAVIQKNYLRQDGMSEKFFTKYQVQMPEWIEKHRQELQEARLPSTVESLVNKKINESELNNDEINEILAGCGKGNSSCINKAFAMLIDAHHGLEDSQLKLIQEYL